MPHSYVIDTFAWVEYFIGSQHGKIASQYIEGGKASTPTIVLTELSKWFLKEIESRRRKLADMKQAFDFINSRTLIVDLDESIARKAGETDFLMKKKIHDWPIADSIVQATALTQGARVVSGDPHFKAVDNSIIIESMTSRKEKPFRDRERSQLHMGRFMFLSLGEGCRFFFVTMTSAHSNSQ